MTPFLLIPLSALLGNVVLTGLAFAVGCRDKTIAFLLRGLPLSLSIWLLVDVLSFFSLGPEYDPIIARIGALGVILAATGLLVFAFRVIGITNNVVYWNLVGFGGMICGLALFTDYLIVLPTGAFVAVSKIDSFAELWSGGIAGGAASYPVVSLAFGAAVVSGLLVLWQLKVRGCAYHSSVLGAVLLSLGLSLGLLLLIFVAAPAVFDLPGYSRFGSSTAVFMGFGVFWAVRQHKLTELSLESRAEEIFDLVAEGLILTDPTGKVEWLNESATELLGAIEEPAAELNLTAFLDGRRSHPERPGEKIYLDAEGRKRHLLVSEEGLFVRGMELAKLFLLRDIAKSQETEDELARVTKIIREREKLEEARVLRNEKNEALGTLAGGIAHDFTNLLAAILGFTTVVQDELGPEHPIQSDLRETIKAARRTQRIVEQILSFCRKDDYQYERTDLRAVVEEAVDLLRVSLPSTVEMNFTSCEDPLPAECAKSELIQVIIGLGTNADRAMPERRGELSISLAQMELSEDLKSAYPHLREGRYATLVVEDTGFGISEEDLPKIFDPFFTQWKNTQQTGTGLGLSAAYGIVQAHSGEIDVESEVGRGTKFTVLLPLSD